MLGLAKVEMCVSFWGERASFLGDRIDFLGDSGSFLGDSVSFLGRSDDCSKLGRVSHGGVRREGEEIGEVDGEGEVNPVTATLGELFEFEFELEREREEWERD